MSSSHMYYGGGKPLGLQKNLRKGAPSSSESRKRCFLRLLQEEKRLHLQGGGLDQGGKGGYLFVK